MNIKRKEDDMIVAPYLFWERRWFQINKGNYKEKRAKVGHRDKNTNSPFFSEGGGDTK